MDRFLPPSVWPKRGVNFLWLLDGFLFAGIGALLFVGWVWGVHGQVDDWSKYAAVSFFGMSALATQPWWRGGTVLGDEFSASVRRACVTLVIVAAVLMAAVFFLGLYGDFSRGWLLGLVVLSVPCLIATHTYHLRRVSGPSPMRRLFGLNILARTATEAVDELDRRFLEDDATGIAFANANTLNLTNRSESLRRRLSEFLVFNDGVGIDIASFIRYGRRFPQNLNGTDLVPFYLEQTKHSLRIFLLGASPHVVAAVADVLSNRYPRHSIVGNQHGFFAEGETLRICRRIRSLETDVLIVALGSPKQETWIGEYGGHTGATLLFAVGGLFDFLSGQASRAPVWVRNWRLEWLYRLAREPRRLWRGYLIGNMTFLRDVMVESRH